MTEVSDNKCGKQAAACGSQREGGLTHRDLDAAYENTDNNCDSKCCKTEVVDIEKLLAFISGLACAYRCDLCSFLVNVSLEELGNDLNKENNAYNAEEVSDTVTYCYDILKSGYCIGSFAVNRAESILCG